MWETYRPAKFHDPFAAPREGSARAATPKAPRPPLTAWSRDQRGAMGQTVRRARVVPARRMICSAAGAFDGKARLEDQTSRRLGRGPLSVPEDDEHVHGPARRRLPPRRHRCVQPVDARRVHGRRPAAPDRSVPDAVVDIDVSVAKLREAKSLGFRGVIISAYPSGNPKLSDDDDPFWAAARKQGVPLHIHVGSEPGRAAPTEPGAGARKGWRSPGVHRQVARPALHGRRGGRACRASCRSSSTPGCSTGSPGCASSPRRRARVGSRTSWSTWTTTGGATARGRTRSSSCCRASTSGATG